MTIQEIIEMWNGCCDGEGSGGSECGGAVIVTATEDDEKFVLSKTWNELRTLLNSGTIVMLQFSGADFTNNSLLVSCTHDRGYEATFLDANGNVYAICDTADGYPSFAD